ncbi:MAG: hypothetical protein NC299_12915 [Lachnospiraceae bacterium]|nr:hypothetical protein [Ruminococcus sp.]MCM1276239.1 hypothetical protein [Lachnospiraceae bacterium]
MGHLDYLDECRITCSVEEFQAALGKAVFGLALMGAGMFVGRNVEFDEESEDDENDE